jgi:putative heme degradation protein
MAINVPNLNDLTAALDKVVDTIEKLGSLVDRAAVRGYALFEWRRAKQVSDELTHRLMASKRIARRQGVRFLPLFAVYFDNPTLENWIELRGEAAEILHEVSKLLRELDIHTSEIVTEDFFDKLQYVLELREHILMDFVRIEQPTTDSQINSLKKFAYAYGEVVTSLYFTNRSFARYLEDMKQEN